MSAARGLQPHEIDAWLGDTRLTEEQRAEFERRVTEYHASIAGREGEPADYFDEDNAAWIAALEAVDPPTPETEAPRDH